MLLLSS